MEYHYIPEYTSALPFVNNPSNVTSNFATSAPTYGAKKFILIANGLDSSTQIIVDIEVIMEFEPVIQQLNNYVVAYADSFVPIDPTLRFLSSQREIVISKPSNHQTGFVNTNLGFQTYQTDYQPPKYIPPNKKWRFEKKIDFALS